MRLAIAILSVLVCQWRLTVKIAIHEAMPCPYNIRLGRDTAMPYHLYHSGNTGIDIIPK